jgi:predicted amidophosphoribosyltransferase
MGLKNCPKCGRETTDTTNTCIHCGARLEENQQAGYAGDHGQTNIDQNTVGNTVNDVQNDLPPTDKKKKLKTPV